MPYAGSGEARYTMQGVPNTVPAHSTNELRACRMVLTALSGGWRWIPTQTRLPQRFTIMPGDCTCGTEPNLVQLNEVRNVCGMPDY
jgi:hypothetical protein